jgi:hypothetical protein
VCEIVVLKFEEGGHGFICDHFSDADVALNEVGDLGVVVDAEEFGGSRETFHHSKVIGHQLCIIN